MADSYAIFEDRNQQYRVSPGDRVQIALDANLQPDATVSFDKVCVVGGGDSVRIGRPYVDGARVTATVVTQELKGPKLVVAKYRRRKNSRRRTGFRARHTEIRIDSIEG